MFQRLIPTSARVRRLTLFLAALLLAAIPALPAGGVALAQTPADQPPVFVNEDRQVVERKDDGRFIARPVFSRPVDVLFYAVRHPDSGDWLTSTYRVQGGDKELSDGWEYTIEYPALDEQPDLDPDQSYLLALLVKNPNGGDLWPYYALVPEHQSGKLWDKVLQSLEPDRWGRAMARWAIEGVHGALCGVVEQATGSDSSNCRGG